MRALIVLFLVFGFPATAQTVQKCVDSKGHVTLTSGACPGGHREVATYDAKPERVTAEQRARQAELAAWQRQQDAARAGSSRVYYGTAPRADPKRQRCEAAKEWRRNQAEIVGLRRTHDMLRRWDDYVARECR